MRESFHRRKSRFLNSCHQVAQLLAEIFPEQLSDGRVAQNSYRPQQLVVKKHRWKIVGVFLKSQVSALKGRWKDVATSSSNIIFNIISWLVIGHRMR